MDLARLVESYGYLAVFGGTLLEGETILALAGFAAFNGYLSLPVVIAVAIVGAVLGDQIFFAIGRHAKGKVFAWFPAVEPKVVYVNAILKKYDGWVVVGVRFMYGFRIAGPIAIGVSNMSWGRFLFFNTVGAIIWAPLIAGAGYVFGHALLRVLERMRGYEIWVFGIAIAALLAWIAWQWVRRAKMRSAARKGRREE
jgi:membrane protein DedA with SNARE-associated domain